MNYALGPGHPVVYQIATTLQKAKVQWFAEELNYKFYFHSIWGENKNQTEFIPSNKWTRVEEHVHNKKIDGPFYKYQEDFTWPSFFVINGEKHEPTGPNLVEWYDKMNWQLIFEFQDVNPSTRNFKSELRYCFPLLNLYFIAKIIIKEFRKYIRALECSFDWSTYSPRHWGVVVNRSFLP